MCKLNYVWLVKKNLVNIKQKIEWHINRIFSLYNHYSLAFAPKGAKVHWRSGLCVNSRACQGVQSPLILGQRRPAGTNKLDV